MLTQTKTILAAGLGGLILLAPSSALAATETDFSCMSHKVWPKHHLSHRYREFDVVLQNDCPGPVYWTMCIERLERETNSVWETLKPSGFVEPGKKARVNLQTRKDERPEAFRPRYEEFYVNIGYAVDSAATAECFARDCESKKSDLRAAIRENEKLWQKAEAALADRISDECPDSGWETSAREECAAKLREASRKQIQAFAIRDGQLRKELAAIDPERCAVWSGGLVTD